MEIPQTLDELRLSRYVDFIVAAREMQDAENPIPAMVKSVAAFTGASIEALYQAEIGGAGEDSLLASVSNIFGHAASLVAHGAPKYRMPNEVYQYKGVGFKLPSITESAIKGTKKSSIVSVVEAIEVMEINRLLTQHTNSVRGKGIGDKIRKEAERILEGQADQSAIEAIKKATEQAVEREVQRQADPNGSQLYSRYLKQCAILLRKEGEELPFDDEARDAFLTERTVFFAEISTQAAIDVDFFLSSTLQNYEQYRITDGFSSLQNFVLAVEIMPKK